jgi:outer membrane protein insertion porin family
MQVGRLVWIGLWLGLMTFGIGQAPELSGTLADVQVRGTTDYQTLIKTVIRSRPGAPVPSIALESERNLILSMGVFSSVSVSFEEDNSGFILVVEVKENPRIAEVKVENSTILPQETWIEGLKGKLIEAGQVLNTTRAEEARLSIRDEYKRVGFPFDVPVVLSVTAQFPATVQPTDTAAQPDTAQADVVSSVNNVPEGTPVILTYTVTETAPLREIKYEGATVLEESLLNNFFDTLEQKKVFDTQAYGSALSDVAAAYKKQGYRDSGVDIRNTTLLDGVLTVRFRELKIISFDTTAIGVDPSEFSLKVGDLYNYDVLLEDIKGLSKGRDTDIFLKPVPTATGVIVAFGSGVPASAGEITTITFEGNMAIPSEELLPLLKLTTGDNFSSALAAEDYANILQYYRDKGYLLEVLPDKTYFNYLDGTYVIRLTEYKIASYNVVFDKPDPKSKDYIVTRYLPKPGSIYNDNEILDGLRRVARLGFIVPLNRQPGPAENPGEVLVTVNVREQPSGQFRPELGYTTSATSSEFTGNLVFEDTNFLGEAHNFSAELNAQTSDIGFLLGGNVAYRIPWLYVDFLDFKEIPTSLSASLFSNVSDNQAISADGSTTICPKVADRKEDSCNKDQRIKVGDYTSRDTGLSFRVGRQILPDTNLSLSAQGSLSEYKLEPNIKCDYDSTGKPKDPKCALERGEALEFLPQGGLSSFIKSEITYDSRDSANFPTEGVSANASVGLGFGNDYRNPDTQKQGSYTYSPFEFGVRTYVQLQDIIPSVENPNHVFAFKVNGGHQFGGDYPATRYFYVGDSFSNDTLIRGYRRDDTDYSQSYAIGTLEYRYDFGLDTFATETIIALAYADLGWTSSVPGYTDYATPVLAGAGLGVQVNLNIAGFGLPAIRFDYSFSGQNPSGLFRFRLGPVF